MSVCVRCEHTHIYFLSINEGRIRFDLIVRVSGASANYTYTYECYTFTSLFFIFVLSCREMISFIISSQGNHFVLVEYSCDVYSEHGLYYGFIYG